MAHQFISDGTPWLDRIERCRECGLPRVNRVHRVPDVTEQQNEHRRRTGDGEA